MLHHTYSDKPKHLKLLLRSHKVISGAFFHIKIHSSVVVLMVHLKAAFFKLKFAQSFRSRSLRELLLLTVSPGKPLRQAVATHVALDPQRGW